MRQTSEMPTPPSTLRALLPRGEAPGRTEMQNKLSKRFGEDAEVECLCEAPCGARWALMLRQDEQEFQIWMEASAAQHLDVHVKTGALSETVHEDAQASDFSIVVTTHFGDLPLWDYHAQLKILAAVAGDCVLVIDDSSCMPHQPEWLAQVAEQDTPPSPRSLYSLHCVMDDQDVWAHTHGLSRCGSIELEMLDVPKSRIHCLAPLVHAVAAQWIELGPPEAGQPFIPGKDMELIWLPWRDALSKRKPRGPGGMEDRDAVHSVDSGVLFVPKGGWTGRKLCCPSMLASTLEGNPMLYLSNMETVRMALLAAERLPRFAALFATHGAKPDWRFLVKLGYVIDEDDEQREHLWFEVHAIAGGHVEATLLNQPYHVAGLAEGDRGKRPLELLSDWTILSPDGQFGPDVVHRLEELASRPH